MHAKSVAHILRGADLFNAAAVHACVGGGCLNLNDIPWAKKQLKQTTSRHSSLSAPRDLLTPQ
jgi:hypothetical protein